MAFFQKSLLCLLAGLVLMNSPALAYDCARPCPSPAALQLCAQSCSRERMQDLQQYGGQAVFKEKAICSRMQVQQAAPVLSGLPFSLGPAPLSAAAAFLPLVFSPKAPSLEVFSHGPPAPSMLHSVYLPVSPQNAPPSRS